MLVKEKNNNLSRRKRDYHKYLNKKKPEQVESDQLSVIPEDLKTKIYNLLAKKQ